MTQPASHPGRVPEFLSRLHDGDLSAAERAQFESHRAHCAECRGLAAEFEAAMALYRSSRPRPPAPDLSARILRKLQSASPRRSPLGVTFGIDLRWAGAFAAALLAVVVGSSVIARREAAERRIIAETAPIPVRMERQTRPPEKVREQGAATESSTVRQKALLPPAPAASKDNEERPNLSLKAAPAAPPAPGANAFAQAPPDQNKPDQNKEANERDAAGRRASDRAAEPKPQARARAIAPPVSRGEPAPPPPPPPPSVRLEASGGEGALSSKLASDLSSTPPRLEIVPIDSAGPAPALLNAAAIDVPAELKGREFVLSVEASGRVRQVQPSDSERLDKKVSAQSPSRAAGLSGAKTEQPLLDLRFAPGDRPRLLRVRIQ